MLAEELIEKIVLGNKIIPEIYKFDANMFLHNFIFVLRINIGINLKESLVNLLIKRCSKRNL